MLRELSAQQFIVLSSFRRHRLAISSTMLALSKPPRNGTRSTRDESVPSLMTTALAVTFRTHIPIHQTNFSLQVPGFLRCHVMKYIQPLSAFANSRTCRVRENISLVCRFLKRSKSHAQSVSLTLQSQRHSVLFRSHCFVPHSPPQSHMNWYGNPLGNPALAPHRLPLINTGRCLS